MNKLIIRRMKSEDAEEISQLEKETFSQPWSYQGFLDALAMENVIFLVAEEDGILAGYCGMYCALDEGEITNVAIKESYRKRGIGKQLMKELIQEAKQADIINIILEVRVSNEGAIHLYESVGFVIQGIRKGFYEFPKEDGYVMTLEL